MPLSVSWKRTSVGAGAIFLEQSTQGSLGDELGRREIVILQLLKEEGLESFGIRHGVDLAWLQVIFKPFPSLGHLPHCELFLFIS